MQLSPAKAPVSPVLELLLAFSQSPYLAVGVASTQLVLDRAFGGQLLAQAYFDSFARSTGYLKGQPADDLPAKVYQPTAVSHLGDRERDNIVQSHRLDRGGDKREDRWTDNWRQPAAVIEARPGPAKWLVAEVPVF
ncbi:hypothetical protein D3C75_1000850 [compost metagenome]